MTRRAKLIRRSEPALTGARDHAEGAGPGQVAGRGATAAPSSAPADTGRRASPPEPWELRTGRGAMRPSPSLAGEAAAEDREPDGPLSEADDTPRPLARRGASLSAALADLADLLSPRRALDRAGIPGARQLTPPASLTAAAIAINLIGLALPLAALQVYDRVIPSGATHTLNLLLSGLIVVFVIEFLLRSARAVLLGRAAARYAHSLAAEGVGRFLASGADLGREGPARSAERIDGIARIGSYLGSASRQVAIDLPFAAVFFAAVAVIGGWLVAVPLALATVLTALALAQSRAIGKAMGRRTRQRVAAARRWQDLFDALPTIKALALEPRMERGFEAGNAGGARAQEALAQATARAQTMSAALGQAITLAVVAGGAVLAAAGEMTIGALVACTTLSGRAVQPILRVAGLWSEYQGYRQSAERAAALFELPPARLAAGSARRAAPEIVIMTGAERERIAPGDLVTLSASPAAVRRLFRTVSGIAPAPPPSVAIDAMTPAAYRAAAPEAIRWIMPDPPVFDGTVLDNLTQFSRRGGAGEAIALAELLGLRPALLRLPAGLETRLSGDGAPGCPRPLARAIAILRQLAGGPSLLLVEGVFAGLDPALADRLSEYLLDQRGRATILVSGAPRGLLRAADREVILD